MGCAVGGQMHQVFCRPEQMIMKDLVDLSLSASISPERCFSAPSLPACLGRLVSFARFLSVSLVRSTSSPYLSNQKGFPLSKGTNRAEEENRVQWERGRG